MLQPRIETGKNLFQGIKAMCQEAERAGLKLMRLSIGQPTGPAILSARKKAAELVMSEEEAIHEYADNGCPPASDFARRFVQAHVEEDLEECGEAVACLPIPGIKPMLPVVLMASLQGTPKEKRPLWVYTTTRPGYPTPADWAKYLENGSTLRHQPLVTSPDNGFRFDPKSISRPGERLIMMNYPGNPTGQVATREWLEEVCAWCESNQARLFNDAAYSALSYGSDHCTLADVAVHYPLLSWLEAFSASKLGNFTGWRIGAMVGSADFVADVATVKGNTDSGFNSALALGILHTLEHDQESVLRVRDMYRRRAELLVNLLSERGLRLAVAPKAGFFTLWHCPREAFGQRIESAEHFNRLMITRTGVVGVHFDPYVRYAVCGDIEEMAAGLAGAFAEAAVKY